MTDRAQFEAMLEALINEDQETAKEIFHNIVVGKSREIYEELLESDFGQDSGNPYKKEEDEEEEESVGDEEEPEDDGEEPEGDIEDRVMDLEDALEDLKAEFEQLLQGEEHEEEQDPGHHGDIHAADIEADLMGAGGEEEQEEGVMHHVHHHMNEYVDKVPLPKHGDNGVNTKSAVAGKNDMGGSAKNLAQSFSTEKGGTQGGLAKPTTTVMDAGNINKPGANAGKTAFKKKEPGHGPEKKGEGEKSVSAKSLISTKVR